MSYKLQAVGGKKALRGYTSQVAILWEEIVVMRFSALRLETTGLLRGSKIRMQSVQLGILARIKTEPLSDPKDMEVLISHTCQTSRIIGMIRTNVVLPDYI